MEMLTLKARPRESLQSYTVELGIAFGVELKAEEITSLY